MRANDKIEETPVAQPNTLKLNAVKEAARSGARIRGLHMTFAAPTIIELTAAGLDFVYVDGEHGCFDARDIEAACIAAERHGLTAIARVPDRMPGTITRFLDRGIQGIVVPHVETVAQARDAVASVYYAPLGERSFGGGRPVFLSAPDKPAFLQHCNATMSLCLMIESGAGIDEAGALAAVEGVDYLSFGMMDLAQSLGHPGNPGHAEVKRAVERAGAAIRAAGKRVREDFMHYAWINDVIVAGLKQVMPA
jgi:2-keto-3-deoxy-L-rhamnonate aldolase RhmA